MIVSGNNKLGLAKSIHSLYPSAVFFSRANGYDLTNLEIQQKFALESLLHNEVIISSALWKFNQTVLLDTVYKTCIEHNHSPHIIVVGSTTDRVKNGKAWLYNAEKKALRDYANTLALGGVWENKKPKVSYISFGTLSNNQVKHPDRKCLDIDYAATYIKWLLDQPKFLNINEISIDPMQGDFWNDN